MFAYGLGIKSDSAIIFSLAFVCGIQYKEFVVLLLSNKKSVLYGVSIL